MKTEKRALSFSDVFFGSMIVLSALTCFALTSCGSGGSSSPPAATTTTTTATASDVGGGSYVVVNGVKYTCGDATKMATSCVAINTTGKVIVQPIGATIVEEGWLGAAFVFSGFPNGQKIGSFPAKPNELDLYNSDLTGIAGVGLGINGWTGWGGGYWWKQPTTDSFLIGW
jgi:hypothetical protein